MGSDCHEVNLACFRNMGEEEIRCAVFEFSENIRYTLLQQVLKRKMLNVSLSIPPPPKWVILSCLEVGTCIPRETVK